MLPWLPLPQVLQLMSDLRLSLDWGDFVYFFWAYLWKSIEFLRVDRLFNEQGAFQVQIALISQLPSACSQKPSLLSPTWPSFFLVDFCFSLPSFCSTCSTTPLPRGVITPLSRTARPGKKYTSLACPSAASVRREGLDGRMNICFSLSFFFSQFVSAGKYHVEQDPQFALVHLQFVHWADKLLKVTLFVVCVLPLFFLQTMTINLRTLGTARLNASCSPPSLQLIL
jgi:hypothetical protein